LLEVGPELPAVEKPPSPLAPDMPPPSETTLLDAEPSAEELLLADGPLPVVEKPPSPLAPDIPPCSELFLPMSIPLYINGAITKLQSPSNQKKR